MVRRDIKLFVKIFPTFDKDMNNFKIETNRKSIHIRSPPDIAKYEPKFVYWEFITDGIFCNTCQDNIYMEVVENSVHRALNGEDIVILAYGPSGTGKTYTMTGLKGRFKQRGIAPRIISELYQLKKQLHEVAKIRVSLSILEFLDKNVYNLLSPRRNKVCIQKGVPVIKCMRESQALSGLFEAESRRKFEQFNVSCSTLVITVHLNMMWFGKDDSQILSKIHLVDTAGTESIPSSTRSDKCQIMSNLTLSWIGSVLAKAYRGHFEEDQSAILRASPLTEFIGPSFLKGNVRFIAHVRLTADDIGRTLSALKFGSDIKKLPIQEVIYTRKPDNAMKIQALEEENRHLKDEILLNELLQGQYTENNVTYEETEHIRRQVEFYLDGKIQERALLSVTKCSIVLPIIKSIYLTEIEDLKKLIRSDDKLMASLRSSGSTRSFSKKGSTSSIRGHSNKKSMSIRISKSKSNIRHSRSFSMVNKPGKSFISPEIPDSVISEDEDLRDTMWMEFFKRYPEIHRRVKFTKQVLVNAEKARENISMEAVKLRCRLDDAKLQLENAQWSRKAILGDSIGADGHVVHSEAENQASIELDEITKEFYKARKQAAHTHSKYMDAAATFNEINEIARIEFQKYLNLNYTNTLLLPDLRDEKVLSPKISEDLISQEGTIRTTQARSFFNELQLKYGKDMTATEDRCLQLN